MCSKLKELLLKEAQRSGSDTTFTTAFYWSNKLSNIHKKLSTLEEDGGVRTFSSVFEPFISWLSSSSTEKNKTIYVFGETQSPSALASLIENNVMFPTSWSKELEPHNALPKLNTTA